MRVDKAIKVNNFRNNFSLHQRRRPLTFIIRYLWDLFSMARSVAIERVRVSIARKISLRIFQDLLTQVHSNIGYSLCFKNILV